MFIIKSASTSEKLEELLNNSPDNYSIYQILPASSGHYFTVIFKKLQKGDN